MESVEPSLAIHTYEPNAADAWYRYSGPEKFGYVRMKDEDAAVFLARYHEAVSQESRFVGSGNHAMVFDLIGAPSEKPRSCAKLSWEGGALSVEVRGKKFAELPEEYRHLRRIQDYFDVVKAEHRARLAANPNASFKPQVDPERESLAQNCAREVLEEAGFHGAVPRAHAVVALERKHEGVTDEGGHPFDVTEQAKAILMERVEGATVQDLLLRRVDWWDEAAEGDLAAAAETLERMVAALAAGGIAHNDLSNRNVMLERGTLKPVIIDFGKASTDVGSEEYLDGKHAGEIATWIRRFKNNPNATSEDLAEKLDEFLAI